MLWHGLSQLGYDWQVISLYQANARVSVRFVRTIKIRDGCIPLQIFVQHVASYPRLPGSPGSQVASLLQPFCYVPPPGYVPPRNNQSAAAAAAAGGNGTAAGSAANVTCVPEALAIDNLATTITRSTGESYSLYEQGAIHWCTAYVSMSCLSASGPEQCVRELLASIIVANRSTTANGTATDGGNGLSSILLPAVLTGVLSLGFIVATAWCIHRRGVAPRGSSLGAHPGGGAAAADDPEGGLGGGGAGLGGVGGRVGHALSRLLPRSADANKSKPFVPGYVPVVSKEALDRIAKVRAELSTKMVVASSDDDLSDVRNLHLVGRGTFGRVYKGEWRGVTVALKVISVPVSQYGQAQWQAVMGEAAISTLLNHPCVLQTYSVALLELSPARKPASTVSEEGGTPSAATNAVGAAGAAAHHSGEQSPLATASSPLEELAPFYQLKMVSEFCEGGSVVNALRRMQFYDSVGGGTVRLPAIIDIAMQVASGMAYLHSANIVHADLKAANVLLKQQPGSGRLQAKVADFGLSFRVEPEATHVTKGQLGSLTHMAPEVLMHGRVSKASDVYSFGILLYELYTGQAAYWDVPQPMLAYHVATAGGRPLLPQHCPPAFRGLAKACWSADVAARPTFKQVYDGLQALAASLKSFKGPLQSSPSGGGAAAAAAAATATDATEPGGPPPAAAIALARSGAALVSTPEGGGREGGVGVGAPASAGVGVPAAAGVGGVATGAAAGGGVAGAGVGVGAGGWPKSCETEGPSCGAFIQGGPDAAESLGPLQPESHASSMGLLQTVEGVAAAAAAVGSSEAHAARAAAAASAAPPPSVLVLRGVELLAGRAPSVPSTAAVSFVPSAGASSLAGASEGP